MIELVFCLLAAGASSAWLWLFGEDTPPFGVRRRLHRFTVRYMVALRLWASLGALAAVFVVLAHQATHSRLP